MSIEARNLGHVYSPDTPFAYQALDGASVRIPEGKMTAIIGQTGSGKSTFVQHLNGLLVPTAGELEVLGRKILPGMKIKDLKELRRQVGLVFQFPEYQLFEETIGRDIAFGPKNFGVSEEDALEQVKAVLPVVGLDESYLERSPFDLSGGQKRRVAIAGILVLDPEVLVLDEPAAGLDPQGATEMMELFADLNIKAGKTVLLVTHDMEHVLKYCDHVIVMDQGKVAREADVDEFFSHPEWLEAIGIDPPGIVRLQLRLRERGMDLGPIRLRDRDLIEAVRDWKKDHDTGTQQDTEVTGK
ncbi:energy-coupling factor transporter ATPase [Faecalibaculum rodentium]|uniref:Energy-coupling factor transporter ATP-binding protein EcfA2 n=4 Tax=Faecalibaculum rodentium TaxID=1702221 RepID=A0A1Q9YKI1_9FIRM|nr:energy-coupling factor transporter ATPase [Faecalibaculum rodentium]OLU45105.1 energy-coupling factor transporter ATPase [Faecalibaculum rodentium]